jgi:hypothetical protein
VGVVANLNAQETEQAVVDSGPDIVFRNRLAAIEVTLTPHDLAHALDPIDAEIAAQAPAVFGKGDPVLVRSYPGRTQAEAAGLFQREAAQTQGLLVGHLHEAGAS